MYGITTPLHYQHSLIFIYLITSNNGPNIQENCETWSQSCRNNLVLAQYTIKLQHATKKNIQKILSPKKQKLESQLKDISIPICIKKAKIATSKYWNEWKQTRQLEKLNAVHKVDLKKLKEENPRLAQELEASQKEVMVMEEDVKIVIDAFQQQIFLLNKERYKFQKQKVQLKKKCEEILRLKKAIRMQAQKHIFKLTTWGVYTKQAHVMACYLASVGTTEKKIGETIKTIGKIMNVEVNHVMSLWTVECAVLESGMAAEIQLGYELAKSNSKFLFILYNTLLMMETQELTYSSDSTFHRHIEYEVHTVVVQIIDYTKADMAPEWKSCSLGIGTLTNHTSQTQVDGLRKRLEEIAKIFNESPLAKREGLIFKVNDFAYKLIGTSGDHAADQKKSHAILKEWKLKVILQ